MLAALLNEGVPWHKIEGGWWLVGGLHNGPLTAVLSVKLSKCHHLRFQHTPNRWELLGLPFQLSHTTTAWEENLIFYVKKMLVCVCLCVDLVVFEVENYQNA